MYNFVLVALALYRVSKLIAVDRGPGDISLNLRSVVRDQFGVQSWQAEGIACPVCVSFWLAWLFAVILGKKQYVLNSLALSAIAAVISDVSN